MIDVRCLENEMLKCIEAHDYCKTCPDPKLREACNNLWLAGIRYRRGAEALPSGSRTTSKSDYRTGGR